MKDLRCGLVDESGRGEIAFADPKRDDVRATAAVMENLDDSAWRSRSRFRPQSSEKVVVPSSLRPTLH